MTQAHASRYSRRQQLTRRQREVLEAVLDNLTNKEISKRLSISESAVKFHVSSLLGRFKARRRSELIVMYYEFAGPELRRRLPH
jgi:DNA-binding CsgD family transcriptional regulator